MQLQQSCVWTRFPGLGKGSQGSRGCDRQGCVASALLPDRACLTTRQHRALPQPTKHQRDCTIIVAASPRRAACWPVSDQTSALFCFHFLLVLCLSQESIGRFSLSLFPVGGPHGVLIGESWILLEIESQLSVVGYRLVGTSCWSQFLLLNARKFFRIIICTGKI